MSHIKVILIALAGVLLAIAPSARADSLQLKNGNFVQGKYLGGTERAVRFVVEGKIHLYGIDEILSISFASADADGGIPSNAADRKIRPSLAPKSLGPKSSLIAFDSQPVSSKRMEPAPLPHHAQTRRALGTPAPTAPVHPGKLRGSKNAAAGAAEHR